MKADRIVVGVFILAIGILVFAMPSPYTAAKKKQEAADRLEILQQKVAAKKAAGEMTNNEFVDTFLKQAD